MGQAKIISGGPDGLYNVALVKHAGKSAARLTAIEKELGELTGKIDAAGVAVSDAATILTAAQEASNEAIRQENSPAPTLTAVPRWYNRGNGACRNISPAWPFAYVGVYLLTCSYVIASPAWARFSVTPPIGGGLPDAETGRAYTSTEINFTLSEGSVPFETGDGFDIAVTEESRYPVTPVKISQAAVVNAQNALITARRNLAALRLSKAGLEKEWAMLQRAMRTEYRPVAWCTDLTTDLAAGATVGTMEINGEGGARAKIILSPGGKVNRSRGLLQHVGVSSPSATFLNLCRFPAWQKWKPTYRVGTIAAINYTADTCDVAIGQERSSQQGLPINQAGEDYTATVGGIAGWNDFAAKNPTFPLVTNTGDTNLTMTPALMADIKAVQAEVQDRNTYRTDTEQYGRLDNWQLMAPGGAGDCEDYALTKAQKLLAKGYAASAIKIEVGTMEDGTSHAWLVVQTDQGDIALDNNYKNPQANDGLPYTDRRRQTGQVWQQKQGVKLKKVPIEYMAGDNAAAFDVGDRVVIEFVDQDWKKPKVIGFETNPRRDNWALACASYDTISGMRNGAFKRAGKKTGAVWIGYPLNGVNNGGYITKITDRYYHWLNGAAIDVRDLKTNATVTSVNMPWPAYQDTVGDISLQDDVADIKIYSLEYDEQVSPDGNARKLLMNGQPLIFQVAGAKRMFFAGCVQYVRGSLYAVQGVKTSVFTADVVVKLARDGKYEDGWLISSQIRLGGRRDHIRYDSKNDCFYLIGEPGDYSVFGINCGYSMHAVMIEKYTSNWQLLYRRLIGGWCITDAINTIWQGEGWVSGQDFYAGMANTHVRHPVAMTLVDVYDDKLFVCRYTEQPLWNPYYGGFWYQGWVPSKIMTLDLMAYPVGAGISSLPFSTWLAPYCDVPPGLGVNTRIISMMHHGGRKELND